MSLSSENYFATPAQREAQRNGYGSSEILGLDDDQFGDISLSFENENEGAADHMLGMYAEAISTDVEKSADVIPFAGKAVVATEVQPAERLVG